MLLLLQGGRFIIGWEDNFFQGEAVIELRGTKRTPDKPVNGGPNAGAKTIAAMGGGIDFHGLKPDVTWTHLAATVEAGSNALILEKQVSWKSGIFILYLLQNARKTIKLLKNKLYYTLGVVTKVH